jgi:hypothetical protein
VTSRSNREQAHNVLLARCVAGKSGASPEGRGVRPAWERGGPRDQVLRTDGQLNVPCSVTTGAEAGDEMIVPPSPPQGAAEPQGSQAGAPHAGAPQAGAIWGAQAGAAPPIARPPEQGERNSMNDGRRQELEPPKQLLQPGAATRLPRTIARHKERVMIWISDALAVGGKTATT